MKYVAYSISKYSPEDFNENGVYTKEEWTSKCDIGKIYGNQVFDEKKYIYMENKYIDVLQYLLVEHGIDCLVVSELEKYPSANDEKHQSLKNKQIEECITTIQEGYILAREQLEFVCRAMLREYIWCKLYSQNKHFIISVGYDFYMYVICEELTDAQKKQIDAIGLFVEQKM